MRKVISRGLCALALCTTTLAGPLAAQTQAPSAPPPTAAAPVGRPNILLILSDDNSAPHSVCRPNENVTSLSLMPNLTAFAAQGMCFNRAYTTAPQCAPSRASIFAGRNPVDLGVTRFAQPVRRDVPFFTDLLRASGYWVGLEGRNHHLSGRGDDPAHVKEVLKESGLSAIGERFDHVNTVNFKKEPLRASDLLGQALDKVPAGKPFFLYLGFNQTHRVFVSDASDIDPKKLKLPADWPDLPEVRADYAQYLSDLRAMDTGIGALMAELKRRGLADNTIVVFMGDNGDAMYRGKGTLYERGNNVPLIVRWPGAAKSGSHSEALVSGVDLAKTFLEAAGVAPDPKMSGVSLASLVKGAASSNGRKYVFTERGWHPGSLTVSEGVDFARAITGERYKLIYNAQPAQPYSPVDQGGRFLRDDSEGIGPGLNLADEERATAPWRAVVVAHKAKALPSHIERIYFERPRQIFELYDLQNDPFELNNLAGKPELAAVETELRHELDKWMALNGDYLPFATDAYRETWDPARKN